MFTMLAELQQTIEETAIPDVIKENYLPSWWPAPVIVYLLVELAFYVYFKTVMVPYANKIIPPSEYRGYGRDRHKLIMRILERKTRTAKVNGRDDLEETARYLIQWFDYAPNHLAGQQQRRVGFDETSFVKKGGPPTLLPRLSEASLGSSLASSSVCSSGPDDSDMEDMVSMNGHVVDDRASDSGSLDEDDSVVDCDENTTNSEKDSEYTVTVLRKDDIDDFMAWGFFGKFVSDLVEWEKEEMNQCYKVFEAMYGLVFKPGRSPNYKLRHLLSLEDCVAMHRPLTFYAQIAAYKWCASQLFRLAGFSRHVSKSGVICWYKPAADDDYSQKLLPLCVFHGVGPGGHANYTALILLGLNRTGRAIYVFENHSVACTLDFKAIPEADYVDGVHEMVDRFSGTHRGISLLGHSFGSSALTWLLHSKLRSRIRQMVILEPVSIMLSESEVIVNMAKPHFKLAIDLVLEHYIRRQYPWYNSELWLEDIPEGVHVVIGLAGKDPLICTAKITEEIEAFCAVNPKIARNMDFIYWKNNLHGMCLGLPWCWKDINDAMLKREMAMMQSKSALRKSKIA